MFVFQSLCFVATPSNMLKPIVVQVKPFTLCYICKLRLNIHAWKSFGFQSKSEYVLLCRCSFNVSPNICRCGRLFFNLSLNICVVLCFDYDRVPIVIVCY